jgi:ElaB/YqjD/DUF883 family membrane-anchored ribosome-binding protein
MNITELNKDEAIKDLKRIVRDSELLLENTAGAAGEKIDEIRARLAEALKSAKQTCRKLEDKTIESAKTADKVIRSHPYQSIAAALGIGVLLGVLIARKS